MDVTFTDAEKLMLLMLCDIHKKVGVDDSFDPDFLSSAIGSGNMWMLSARYSGSIGKEVSRTLADETAEILDMWNFIEEAYEHLDADEKAQLVEDIGLSGPLPIFLGFSTHDAGDHFIAAQGWIEDLQRFRRFRDRDLNSGYQSVAQYRRMLPLFKSIRARLDMQPLSSDDLLSILAARAQPA